MIRLSIEGTTMFSRSLRLLAALSLCVSSAAFGQAAAPAPKEGDKPVTVNGKPIPKSRLDFIVKQRAAQGQPDNEQARRMILDNLITQEVVAQEADRKGFGKGIDVRTQLDLVRQQVLVQALIQDYLKKNPVKDEQLHEEYDRLKAARGDKEYKARHILVDKDTEAKEIIAQLKKGAKFEDLAKQCRPSTAGTSSSWTTSASSRSRPTTRSSRSSRTRCSRRRYRSTSTGCARRRR
jgi:peptidyl-prolyl cis-trans isomerase C